MIYLSQTDKVGHAITHRHSSKLHLFIRNPVGRTGMVGRGTLARWGPNQAADPIVTR